MAKNRATRGELLAGKLTATAADGLTANQKIVDTAFRVTAQLGASDVDRWVWIADRACKVTLVEEIHSVVGGASAAVRPRKITDTSAPGAAASATVKELTTAAIDLTATVNTTQTPALVATAADKQFADGDKLGLDMSGTLTGLVGALVFTFEAV